MAWVLISMVPHPITAPRVTSGQVLLPACGQLFFASVQTSWEMGGGGSISMWFIVSSSAGPTGCSVFKSLDVLPVFAYFVGFVDCLAEELLDFQTYWVRRLCVSH